MNILELEELASKLTINEKIGQLVQLSGDFFKEDQALLVGPQKKLGINDEILPLVGSVLNVVGADKVKEIQSRYLEQSSHKIPLLFMSDIIYGFRTVYPIPLGFSTSWNPKLIEKGYENMATEAVASGAHVTFAPMVDLVKDARWGRCLESLGEDTYLGSQYAAAMVRGIQKDLGPTKGLAACVKHFAAYGAAEGGRDYNNVDMSERRLRQEYLPAYRAAIDAGSKLIMTSFNTIDGIPATGNEWLLKRILREEWGFDGVVISDYAAVQELIAHGYAQDNKDATLKAMNATNDIDMKTACYANELAPLLEEGKLSIEKIDEAVWRVLMLKNDLGLFEDPYRGTSTDREQADVLTSDHLNVAQKIAEESIVLLQNDNGTLPLKSDEKVALIGPYSNSRELMGLWAVHGQMEDVMTLNEALSEQLNIDYIGYSQGCDMLENYDFLGEFGMPAQMIEDYQLSEEEKVNVKKEALTLASQADVIVMALGEHTLQSGEAGSRTSLRLPEKQSELLREVAKLNKKVVLVSFSGRPLVLTDEVPYCDAILQAWFPGTKGAVAIANILSGVVNPSARLTQSFPYNEGQIPIYYNGFSTGRPEDSETHSGRFVSKYLDAPNSPLYAFGYGLSYHKARCSDISINKSTIKMGSGETLKATIQVTNHSEIDGVEVVQLYLHDQTASVVRPIKELKSFNKVLVPANTTVEVDFDVTEDMLAFYQRDLNYGAEPGLFTLMIGLNSNDIKHIEFELIK